MDDLDEMFSLTPPDNEAEPDTSPEVIDTPEAEPAVAEPVVEPQTAEQPKADDRKGWVPVDALLDQRTKWQAASNENADLRRQLDELRRAQTGSPDPYDDPAGYRANMVAEMQSMVAQQVAIARVTDSRARAVTKYGADYVNEAADWAGNYAKADPSFEAQVMSQPDPAEFVIATRKRIEQRQAFEADPDAYVRLRAAELGLAAVAEAASAQETPASKPASKSIVHLKSRGEAPIVRKTEEEEMNAIFNGR